MLEATLPFVSCDLTVAAENIGRWRLSSPASSAYENRHRESNEMGTPLAQKEAFYTTCPDDPQLKPRFQLQKGKLSELLTRQSSPRLSQR